MTKKVANCTENNHWIHHLLANLCAKNPSIQPLKKAHIAPFLDNILLLLANFTAQRYEDERRAEDKGLKYYSHPEPS